MRMMTALSRALLDRRDKKTAPRFGLALHSGPQPDPRVRKTRYLQSFLLDRSDQAVVETTMPRVRHVEQAARNLFYDDRATYVRPEPFAFLGQSDFINTIRSVLSRPYLRSNDISKGGRR